MKLDKKLSGILWIPRWKAQSGWSSKFDLLVKVDLDYLQIQSCYTLKQDTSFVIISFDLIINLFKMLWSATFNHWYCIHLCNL